MSCRYCAIQLVLRISCNDNETLHVTSDHLEVVASTTYDDEGEAGDELSKRSEEFGHPVGKGTLCLRGLSKVMNLNFINCSSPGDPNHQPVLICKIRKGQELRVKCTAKKVRVHPGVPVYLSLAIHCRLRSRGLQKSMQNGLRAQRCRLNTTRTTNSGIRRTGSKPTSERSGH